jgi:Flp pilus assembly protein TadB
MEKKWEWNWKTGTLMVVCCVVAWLVIGILQGVTIVSIIISSVVITIGSGLAVFFLWCSQERRTKST